MTNNEKSGLAMLKKTLDFTDANGVEMSFRFDNGYVIEVSQDYGEASKSVKQWRNGELKREVITTDMSLARKCINQWAKGE